MNAYGSEKHALSALPSITTHKSNPTYPTSARLLLPLLDTRGALGKIKVRVAIENNGRKKKERAAMKEVRDTVRRDDNGQGKHFRSWKAQYHCNMGLATLVAVASAIGLKIAGNSDMGTRTR
jgi:hypothetical protein